jgi:hypothetical protein
MDNNTETGAELQGKIPGKSNVGKRWAGSGATWQPAWVNVRLSVLASPFFTLPKGYMLISKKLLILRHLSVNRG